MKVWEIGTRDDYASISSKVRLTLEEVETFDGRSKISDWEKMESKRALGFERMSLTDAMDFAPLQQIAVSERALEHIYDLIKDDVELLPLEIGGIDYWMLYITAAIDCVDYERSTYSVFPDGRPMTLKAVAFKEEAIEGHNIFKIKEKYGFVLTSDALKERLSELQDTSLHFVLVWDSEREDTIELPFIYQL